MHLQKTIEKPQNTRILNINVKYECKLENCCNFSLADFEGDEIKIAA